MEVVASTPPMPSEVNKPPVNGVLPSGPEDGPEINSNEQAGCEIKDEKDGKLAKMKGQNGSVNLGKVDVSSSVSSTLANVAGAIRMSASLGDNQDYNVGNVETGTVDMESESVASSDDSNIPGTSRGNDSLVIPATVDIEKMHIQAKNIPRFSPATSADNTGDEASACSSADVSSGTSTPVSKVGSMPAGILYNILTTKIQNSTENGPVQASVPVLTSIPGLPHRTPKVMMDPMAMKKTFKCRHCGRLFLKEYDFKQHERCHIEAEERPFQCPQCGKRYQTNGKLNVHMRVHTGEQPYKCDKCKRRFMVQNHWKRHESRCDGTIGPVKWVNLLEVAPTKKVAKTVVKPKSKVKHSVVEISKKGKESRKSTENEVFRCPNCSKLFSNKSNFLKHIKEHKGEKAGDGLYTCKKCGKCYERKSNLKIHMQLHDGNAPHSCKLCEFTCLREYNFRKHMEWHRKQKVAKKMGASYLKKYKCSFCKKAFQNAGHLAFHVKSHTTDKDTTAQSSESEPVAEWPNVQDKMSYGSKFSARCPHCKKHFKRKFDLLKHIKVHEKNLKFTCDYCGSTFISRHNYIKHLHLHTSGEFHNCRSCGLVYSKKVEGHRKEKLCWFKTGEALLGLKGLKNSESGELTKDYWDVMKPDPDTCEWCDLAFNTKSNLYTHMRRHGTGHTCQWCGMEYLKKKQQHDPNFNCYLKTRQGILKKEREKYKKTGTKPVDLLLGKDTLQQGTDESGKDDKQEAMSKMDRRNTDLWRYECKYCDWAFVDSGNRQAHQRRHEEGNHSCRWCGLMYLKIRQKHDRNSRCWLTTREGRLQIAKDGKNGIAAQLKMKTNDASAPNVSLNNLQTAAPNFKTLTTFQVKKQPAAQPKIKPTEDDMEEKAWQCAKCDKAYKSQSYLIQHMLIHSEFKPFTCPMAKCNRTFKLQANLTKHLLHHKFQCEMCLKRFEKEADFKKHMSEANHKFPCKQCERSFIRKLALKYHVVRQHGDKAQNQVKTANQDGGRNKFFCKKCDLGFDKKYSLEIHCRYFHKGASSLSLQEPCPLLKDENGLLSCPRCDIKFKFKSHMERHIETHKPRTHKCPHCAVKVRKLKDLYNHLVKVHKDTQLTCFKCKKTFSEKIAFDNHLESHDLEDNGRHLSQKAEHEFSYSDQNSSEDGWSSEPGVPPETNKSAVEKPENAGLFNCLACKRCFKQKCHLVWHQRSCREYAAPSTRLKKHSKCRYCNMSFPNSGRLMIHMKNLHKQKIALEPSNSMKICYLCGATFTQEWSKTRHMRTVHGQINLNRRRKKQLFECRYCGETSKRLDFHVAHERLHTENIYKIQCQICMIGFKCIEDLEEHGKAHEDEIMQDNQNENNNMEGESKQPDSFLNQRPKKVTRPHVCRYCNLGFERSSILERHEQTHSTESRPYSCQFCDMKFRRLAMLTKHEHLKHRDEEETESEGAKPKAGPMVRADDYKGMSPNFTCRACHREFITQSGWEAHEKNCLEKRGIKPIEFESDITDTQDSATEMPQVGTSSESTSESETLPGISDAITGKSDTMPRKSEGMPGKSQAFPGKSQAMPEKSFADRIAQCKTCHQTMIGSKKQNKNCNVCRAAEKAAGSSEESDSEKKQEGKAWTCDICGQTFATKQTLGNHKRFHTGSLPHSCSVCDEAFPRKDYLQRHEKREHGLEYDSKPSGQTEETVTEGNLTI